MVTSLELLSFNLFFFNIQNPQTHKITPVFLSPIYSGAGVYIIQVAGYLVMSGGYTVILENGAAAEDIFWQVSGYVEIGAKAHMEGTILTATQATFITGSTLNGRIYAQTSVALQMASIVYPTYTANGTNTTTNTNKTTTNGTTTTTTTATTTTERKKVCTRKCTKTRPVCRIATNTVTKEKKKYCSRECIKFVTMCN
jgi:hypothetical protein